MARSRTGGTRGRSARRAASTPLTPERKEKLRALGAAKAAAHRQSNPHPRSITAEAWRVACLDYLRDCDLGAGFDEPLFANPRPDPMPATCRRQTRVWDGHAWGDGWTPPSITYFRWVPRATMLDVICPLVPHGFMLCDAGRSGYRVAVVFRRETAAALCRVLGLGAKYLGGTYDTTWYDAAACTQEGLALCAPARYAGDRVIGVDGLVRIGGTGDPVNAD